MDSKFWILLLEILMTLLSTSHGGFGPPEHCSFYTNKSSIVRDRLKKLQEDLEKRKRELSENPFWSAWNGILPYLLPLLGPLSVLLVLLAVGPCLFNKLMAFVRQQLDDIKMQPIQVHCHRLEMTDRENYV